MTEALEFLLPLKTISEANARTNRWAKAKRVEQHRGVARMMAAHLTVSFPARVTMTRLSWGTLDDDNLRSALKATRDGLADALGIDDGGDAVEWAYAQAKCRKGDYAVRVRIEAKR